MRLRVLLSLQLLVVVAISANDQPKVAREFKDSALIDISGDAQWLLASSRRRVKCADGKDLCYGNILTVYDAATGKTIGELASKRNNDDPKDIESSQFLSPAFIDGRKVGTVELYRDAQRKQSVQEWLTWEPVSGLKEIAPTKLPKEFGYVCPIDGQHLLGLGPPEIWPPYVPVERNGPNLYDMNDPRNRAPRHVSRSLQVVQMDSTQRDIGVLTDAPVRFPFQCSAWRSGNSYLLQDSEVGKNYPESIFGKSLTWFTTERGVSPRPCRVFEGERIHGYAIAVDGSLIAVITSLREDSQHRTFLNVLDGQSCREVKRFELDFPEKPEQRSAFLLFGPKHVTNVPFPDQFARSVAISPDKTKLAVSYGISKGMSGLSFFGVYSMTDGHRLATLEGDTYTPSLRDFFIDDIFSASEAPIAGTLGFSPDSNTLYTSSDDLRQWDISKSK